MMILKRHARLEFMTLQSVIITTSEVKLNKIQIALIQSNLFNIGNFLQMPNVLLGVDSTTALYNPTWSTGPSKSWTRAASQR